MKTDHRTVALLERWEGEDRELESCLDQLRDWMHEVSLLGIPRFGEMATRLQPVREQLIQHFHSENELVDELAELYPAGSPEIAAIRRQADRDHEALLSRLDGLTARMNELEPSFDSWQDCMEQIELWVGALEQHEDQESDCVRMMIPGCGEDASL